MAEEIPHGAAQIVPSNPSTSMVIRDITPNLTTLSVPFLRAGRLRVGGRGTVVRLQSGALAVFSPVALTPEVHSRISAYGNNVRYLAALDIEHHIFLGPWAKAFPDAEIIGVEGLPEKREKDEKTRGLTFRHVFTSGNKRDYRIGGDFDKEFDYEFVDAHLNKELVFYHRPTGTVIEADILFNLPANEQYSRTPPAEQAKLHSGILQRLFSRLQGTQPSPIWQQRGLWYFMGAKDRKGFGESVQRMEKWDIKRVVPCHGDVIENNARGEWDKLFAWYKEGGGKQKSS